MGEHGEAFEESAHALVQALDEWSRCLQEAMTRSGLSRSGLVSRLQDANPKIDNPLLGHWLLGRDQLLGENKRSSRVPSVQDTTRIVARFKPESASQGQRLMRIAQRIENNMAQLHDIKGHQWRSAVVTALTAPGRPTSPSPAHPAAPPDVTDLSPTPADDTPAETWASAAVTQAIPSKDTEQPAIDTPAPLTAAVPPAAVASKSWKRPAVVVAVVGPLLIALVIGTKGWPGATEQGGQSKPSSGSATSAAGTNGHFSDTLGGNSRCSPPKPGPSGVQLRACARVQRDKVAFALKVDNVTDSAVEVTAKVNGSWAGTAHDCEPGPAITHVTVEPGTTFTTDPARCETARQNAPLAYQAEAFIAAGDGQDWIGHVLSPRANVYADRGTLWRCAGDVPC